MTALHDYCCTSDECRFIARDVAIEMSIGAMHADVACPVCGAEMEWLPQIGRMSAGHGPTFTAFETYDGRNRKVRVESIADLRRIERESEQMQRNGEGQIMVWRDYSNDRSNRHDSAIHGSKWHDHPAAPTIPVHSADAIAQRQAAEGVENESVKHL